MKNDIMIDRNMLKNTFKAGPDCLTTDDLERLVSETNPENQHLSQCARCRAELSMLCTFQSEAPLPEEGAAVAWTGPRLERNLEEIKGSVRTRNQKNAGNAKLGWIGRSLTPRTLRWVMSASALAVVTITGFLWERPSPEPEPRADAGSAPAIYRSLQVQMATPPNTVQQISRTLQWKPITGAACYKVTLMKIDKVSFAEVTTNDYLLTIHAVAVDKLKGGKLLLWNVTVLDQKGRILTTSQIARLSPGIVESH